MYRNWRICVHLKLRNEAKQTVFLLFMLVYFQKGKKTQYKRKKMYGNNVITEHMYQRWFANFVLIIRHSKMRSSLVDRLLNEIKTLIANDPWSTTWEITEILHLSPSSSICISWNTRIVLISECHMICLIQI